MNGDFLCWDTNVVITLLKSEPGRPLFALDEIVARVDRKETRLLFSIISRIEVLSLASNAGADQFSRFCDRPNIAVANVDERVADHAYEIRTACRTGGVKVKTPDAIVIATAITHGADQLHTYDDQLCNLSGKSEVQGLKIARPGFDTNEEVLPFVD